MFSYSYIAEEKIFFKYNPTQHKSILHFPHFAHCQFACFVDGISAKHLASQTNIPLLLCIPSYSSYRNNNSTLGHNCSLNTDIKKLHSLCIKPSGSIYLSISPVTLHLHLHLQPFFNMLSFFLRNKH